MTAFHEIRFPVDISGGAVAGPVRRTQIVTAASGYEARNQVWADSKRRYNAGRGFRGLADIHATIVFFEERRGRFAGFRWWDPTDYKSCSPDDEPSPLDQEIGDGDGVTATFQLQKVYGVTFSPWTRTIKKPVAGTVRVAVAGTEKTITTHFTVNTTTGIVTFTGGNIPNSGQAVTAGFEFDVPVRFDTDELQIDMPAFELGNFPNIPIVEIPV